MRASDISAPDSIETFDLQPGDPMYWTELFSYHALHCLKNLKDNGFQIKQPETSDFNTLEESLDGYVGTFASWLTTAVQQSQDGQSISPLNGLPDLTEVVASFSGNPWLLFLGKFALELGTKWLEKKLDPNSEADELAQVMRQAFLDPATEASILKMGLIRDDGSKFLEHIFWHVMYGANHLYQIKKGLNYDDPAKSIAYILEQIQRGLNDEDPDLTLRDLLQQALTKEDEEQNLVSLLDQIEQDLSESEKEHTIYEMLRMIMLSENIIQCPHTGDCIYTKARCKG